MGQHHLLDPGESSLPFCGRSVIRTWPPGPGDVDLDLSRRLGQTPDEVAGQIASALAALTR